MTVQLSCPYCNAGVSVAEVPPSHRVVCPRCGESFPVKVPAGPDDEGGAPRVPVASLNGSPAAVPHTQPPPAPGWSLAAPALIGLVLAAGVLALGLYAFVFHRPAGTSTTPTDAGRRPAATVPPAAVAGLAYLPPDTNVAFAAQPGPLLAYADRTGSDPRQLLTRAGVPDRVFATLDRVGLPLDRIDHVCGGLVLAENSAIPRVFVVLALREPPADPGEFRRQLKATQFTAPSGATRYKADLGGLPVEMSNPDPRTYLFATEGKDLEAAAGRTGSAHLPAGLRESMGKLSPASFAWAATDSGHWSENPGVKLAAALAKQPDLPARLATVRAAAVGMSLEPDPQLLVAVRAADPDAAAKMRAQAADAAAGKKESLRIGGEGAWVTAEGPPDKDTWARLQVMLPKPAGK